jgi:hypothetical protein
LQLVANPKALDISEKEIEEQNKPSRYSKEQKNRKCIHKGRIEAFFLLKVYT